MTDYRICAACSAALNVSEEGDGSYTGAGWELALQKFSEYGTEETIDAKHDGYLCGSCAQYMWNALRLHRARTDP